MNNLMLLRFGAGMIPFVGPAARKKSGWVAVANAGNSQNGDLLVGQKCFSVADVENVVARLREDLTIILHEAKAHFDNDRTR
jgi:hypothetical protein